MNCPRELSYTKSHQWVRFIDSTTVTVGLTEYAENSLGNLVFVDLPSAGAGVEAGQPFADVESVKTVSEIISPVTGTVSEINEALLDEPQRINKDAYGAWIIRVENITHKAEMMNAEEYLRFCGIKG